jgi:hypothetical protein
MKNYLPIIILLFALSATAQVKIGDNPATINSNSLLELESTNKGFLPPRVALNNSTLIAPLTGTVPSGMMVYSSGGTLADGYYYWNGTSWRLVATSDLNAVAKTASATLTKTETFVLASNDITLTLPAITASDNGLAITIKNIGTHTDLAIVQGDGSATIDENSSSELTRNVSQTFVAYAGNWVIKGKQRSTENLLDVGPHSSWSTLKEVVEFLSAHMTAPVVVRLGDETYDVSETIVINLPYAVTFQGLSYGTSTIAAASGLSGKPMFRCVSDCYFKMLQFDATTLSGYGTAAGEDAVRLVGTGTYNEIKDCTFDRFYNTILDSTDAELWLFECDISNARKNGILIHGSVGGVKVRVSETDFIHCVKGINMDKGSGATISLISGTYENSNSTDTAIIYNASKFQSVSALSITGNSWNNVGKFIEGFDFTRSDSRDANVIIESNAGIGDKNPTCNINVLNNASTTTISSGGSWYKASWTNTSSNTCKWTISNNQITYQPTNKRNGWFVITGNVQCNNANRTVSIGIVKNGSSTVRYGETTLRITTGSQPFQFSTVVNLADIEANDYFELYVTSNSSNDVITFQDIQWFANTQ